MACIYIGALNATSDVACSLVHYGKNRARESTVELPKQRQGRADYFNKPSQHSCAKHVGNRFKLAQPIARHLISATHLVLCGRRANTFGGLSGDKLVV